jgi:4-hydroxybenzoate polyprenyltransferase
MPKKKRKRAVKKRVSKTKKVSKGPDALTLALHLIAFILIVFGAWYHKITWLLLGFVPFLVALWYEYMKRH